MTNTFFNSFGEFDVSQLYIALGSISFIGTTFTIENQINCNISRVSVGIYQVSFNQTLSSATYPVLISLGGNSQNDDYQYHYENRTTTGFTIQIREQDDGAGPGDLVDNGFSVLIPKV